MIVHVDALFATRQIIWAKHVLIKTRKGIPISKKNKKKVLIIDSVNENILVCDDDIMDDESIYSIIETNEIEYDKEKKSSEEELDLIDELAGIKIEMMD